MAIKGQALWVKYVCLDADNRPLTGDLAQHTVNWTADNTRAQATNNQGGAGKHVELGNGLYQVLITAAEALCDSGSLDGSSSTSNAIIVPVPVTFDQTGDVYAELPTNFSDLAIEETTGAVTITDATLAKINIEDLKVKYGIPKNKTLYIVRPAADGGNDANDGLTWATPKLEPGNIALVAGDGICVMGVCPITVAIPSTAGLRLFGFGPENSRLTSTTLTMDYSNWDIAGAPMVTLNASMLIEGLQIVGNAEGVVPLAQPRVGAIYGSVVRKCGVFGPQVGFFFRETADNYGHVYENRFENVVFRGVQPVYMDAGNGFHRFIECTMRTSVTTEATGDNKHASLRVERHTSNNWCGRIILDRCHLSSHLSSATEKAYGIYVGTMYDTTNTINGNVGYGRILANGCTFKVYNPLAGGAADIQNDDTAGRTKVIIAPCDGPLVTAGTGDIEYAQPGKDILADTAELQADWTNGGRLDTILDATATATGLSTSQGVITSGIVSATSSIKGASSKDLTQVFTAIGSVTTIGPGSTLRTYTVTRSDTGAPIEGASVWVSTDSAGSNVIAGTRTTDSSGNVTFMLDAGTWFYWVQKDGFQFTLPDSETYA